MLECLAISGEEGENELLRVHSARGPVYFFLLQKFLMPPL